MKRRNKHGCIEICFHEAYTIAPELIIAITARLDKKEPDHQQRTENNNAMMNVWLAERDG
jgi:hypothetical protein